MEKHHIWHFLTLNKMAVLYAFTNQGHGEFSQTNIFAELTEISSQRSPTTQNLAKRKSTGNLA